MSQVSRRHCISSSPMSNIMVVWKSLPTKVANCRSFPYTAPSGPKLGLVCHRPVSRDRFDQGHASRARNEIIESDPHRE